VVNRRGPADGGSSQNGSMSQSRHGLSSRETPVNQTGKKEDGGELGDAEGRVAVNMSGGDLGSYTNQG